MRSRGFPGKRSITATLPPRPPGTAGQPLPDELQHRIERSLDVELTRPGGAPDPAPRGRP